MTNTRLLKAKIVESGKTYREIAHELGISETSLRNKVNNRVPFKVREIAILVQILHITSKDEYFFALDVEKFEQNT